MHENKFKYEYEKMKKIIDVLRKERNDAIANFQVLKTEYDFVKDCLSKNIKELPDNVIHELNEKNIFNSNSTFKETSGRFSREI
tara:strand:+ start:843 stop:1094 length:252 start_codon:yes stop_codon:yes gene_type:complete